MRILVTNDDGISAPGLAVATDIARKLDKVLALTATPRPVAAATPRPLSIDTALVFRVLGCEGLPRGTHVRVRITGSDVLTLEVHANLVARLDGEPAGTAAVDDDSDDESAGAVPLALAIDIDEPAEANEAAATPP